MSPDTGLHDWSPLMSRTVNSAPKPETAATNCAAIASAPSTSVSGAPGTSPPESKSPVASGASTPISALMSFVVGYRVCAPESLSRRDWSLMTRCALRTGSAEPAAAVSASRMSFSAMVKRSGRRWNSDQVAIVNDSSM